MVTARPQPNLANVIAFSRPFRGPDARDFARRDPGNAALLAAALLVVVSGVWLVTGITSIPRHLDCNFSKHRPCHNFVSAD